MSDKPQLPGYSIDDDTPDDNDDAHNNEVATAEPERPGDQALSATATTDDGVAVAVASTATVSSPSPQDLTQPRSTPPNEQEAGEEYSPPTTPPPLPVDEFADPKISALHTIFPDYDAAIL